MLAFSRDRLLQVGQGFLLAVEALSAGDIDTGSQGEEMTKQVKLLQKWRLGSNQKEATNKKTRLQNAVYLSRHPFISDSEESTVLSL